jgi:hypothetical protein
MSPYAASASNPMLGSGAAQPYGLALGSHLLACARARGRTFGLRCLADKLHDIVGPRFVTTLFAAAALMTLLTLMV